MKCALVFEVIGIKECDQEGQIAGGGVVAIYDAGVLAPRRAAPVATGAATADPRAEIVKVAATKVAVPSASLLASR